MQRKTVLFSSFLAVALAAGCSRTSPDRAAPAHEPEPAATTRSEPAFTTTGVYLDPRVTETCKIVGAETFFEYNSADLELPDDTALYQVAECLANGPLRGHKVRVVGHT